jgi:hypothetical protein
MELHVLVLRWDQQIPAEPAKHVELLRRKHPLILHINMGLAERPLNTSSQNFGVRITKNIQPPKRSLKTMLVFVTVSHEHVRSNLPQGQVSHGAKRPLISAQACTG